MLNEKRNIVKVDERYWQDIVKYHSKSAGLVPLLEVEVLGITLYTSLQARTADASEIKWKKRKFSVFSFWIFSLNLDLFFIITADVVSFEEWET